jgi:hypothetical protein
MANRIEKIRVLRNRIRHRRAITRYQDAVQDEDELETISRPMSDRAQELAAYWVRAKILSYDLFIGLMKVLKTVE